MIKAVSVFFFFFQAEDGIRDLTVTGVQTCALPIFEAAEGQQRPYDGVVALGCVIRGDTIHFDIVAIQSARALMDIAVARSLPVGIGMLTVDTEAQAWARARVEEADKGGDAARAALAMVRIKRRLASR